MKPALLYLTHRIPYPPNKGDKLLAWHILRFLSQHFRVYLGTFIDDPKDAQHLPFLQSVCAEVKAISINSKLAKLKSTANLLTGEPLTTAFYKSAEMSAWVGQTVANNHITQGLGFSSGVAPFLMAAPLAHRVMALVDLDSHKWFLYAKESPAPLSWLYQREGKRLFAYEQQLARDCQAVTLCTSEEAKPLQAALSDKTKIHIVNNGVDHHFFDPAQAGESPYPADTPIIAFTGAMDYFPNIDAVLWFAEQVWPQIRAVVPKAQFYIVGSKPAASLQALHGINAITVTGFVDDVRGYIAHAHVIAATLRIARGVQNKVLEAMAMARWVVVSPDAARGVPGVDGVEYRVATGAAHTAQQCIQLLTHAKAANPAARQRILSDYNWDTNLAHYLKLLSP
jgi:polysaccharide biosynthesis protein PslH